MLTHPKIGPTLAADRPLSQPAEKVTDGQFNCKNVIGSAIFPGKGVFIGAPREKHGI
jgi:hypothetical protein